MTSPLGATYGVIYRYGRGSMQTFDGLDVTRPSTTVDYTAQGFMVVLLWGRLRVRDRASCDPPHRLICPIRHVDSRV
jgi:hypothetical protein